MTTASNRHATVASGFNNICGRQHRKWRNRRKPATLRARRFRQSGGRMNPPVVGKPPRTLQNSAFLSTCIADSDQDASSPVESESLSVWH